MNGYLMINVAQTTKGYLTVNVMLTNKAPFTQANCRSANENKNVTM